jgi:CheY-like chemotaxis protein
MIEEGNQVGQITLVCKDGRQVRARYEAHEARGDDGVSYYVSELTPLGPVALVPSTSPERRVLIADDDESTRFLIRTLLSFVEQVEVVGEAADGAQALDLVIEHEPDLVLLDVQMPRIDGLAAAELIRVLRPQTHIVLHSGEADDLTQQRAAKIGLTLLDKMRVNDVIETLIKPRSETAGEPLDPLIETAVVTAVTARSTTPILILGSDRSVPFYNTLAAELFGLPLPAAPSDIDTLRDNYDVLDPRTLIPVERQQRPIERSIAEREPVTATLVVSRSGKATLCRFTSLPFFDTSREFLGAALYVEPIADLH